MHLRPFRFILALLVGLGGLQAAPPPESPATVVAVQIRGTVEVQHDKATTTEPVTEGTQLVTADTITTAAKSSVMLVLPNGSVVSLKEKSRLKIAMALYAPAAADALATSGAEPHETGVSQTSFELTFGEMLTRVRKLNPTSTFTVQTPVSVAAVRGTVFEVAYQPDKQGGAKYRLSTASGLVHVTPHAGKMVAVPDNEQVDFAAELGAGGIKIKNLKAGKLAKRKQQQIEKEAVDNDRTAGEFMQRIRAKPTAKPGAAPGGADRPGAPATPPNAPGNPNDPATPAARSATPPATPKVPPKPVKRPPRRN